VGDLKEREYAELKLRASCFVLITNMLDEEEYLAQKVLRDYKEQTAVELQSRTTKEPEFVAAMFVKKPEELAILGRRMRKRLTARMILDSFDAVVVVILPDGSRMLSESRPFPDKILRSPGASPSIYVTIPRETRDPKTQRLNAQGC